MNIKCPQCDTLYDVSIEIANSGAQVQCAKCNDIFTATPAPEPDPAPEIDVETTANPLLEPVAQAVADDEGSSDLLSEEEKAFFSSFGAKLAEEETTLAQEEAPEPEAQILPAEHEIEAPEVIEPPAVELENDDIGWLEDDTDEQPTNEMPIEEPIEELTKAENSDPVTADDLFEDVDLQIEPEPEEVIVLTAPVEELVPEKTANRPKFLQLSRVQLGWGMLAASITFIIVGAATFRIPIVKAVPGMAGIYEKAGYPVNIRGLEFLGLNHQWMDQGGRIRLVVRGEIVNITNETMPVPQIRFSMIDKSGLEFFQWTKKTSLALLQPKARTRFRAQIPAPADRVRQLKIRFVNR
ncbi:MAG: hypothetical protein GY927_06120 [bacterium]|nr:hypothetical protein [bacterium]